MDGQKVDYTINDDGNISFDLPSHLLTKEGGKQERILVFHLPDTLSSAGTLNFQFDQVEVKQSPNGFSNTYTNADLNKNEQLDFSVKVGKSGDTMANRCKESDAFKADVHIPIHTNAFDGKVTGGTLVMLYKSSCNYLSRLARYS
jgi:hypothetical protein